MMLSILIDENFDIKNCKNGYVITLMINEWWVFLKDTKSLNHLSIFTDLKAVLEFLHRHFTATS